MKKSSLIKLIDVAAFIGFIFVVSTGVLLRYILPTRSGKAIEIFGMNRHEWGDIHFQITVAFLIILSIHLFLHWKFFVRMFQDGFKSAGAYRLVLSIVALVAVLALAIAPFVVPLEYSETSGGAQFGKHKNQISND